MGNAQSFIWNENRSHGIHTWMWWYLSWYLTLVLFLSYHAPRTVSENAYSIWPVTCTVKCCIGHCNTRSQRFPKRLFFLYTVAYRDNILKFSKVSIKNSTVQSPSITMTPGNGKTAQLYTVWHFTSCDEIRRALPQSGSFNNDENGAEQWRTSEFGPTLCRGCLDDKFGLYAPEQPFQGE